MITLVVSKWYLPDGFAVIEGLEHPKFLEEVVNLSTNCRSSLENLGIIFNEFCEPIDQARTFESSDVLAPGGVERLAGGSHCDVDIFLGGAHYRTDHFFGERVHGVDDLLGVHRRDKFIVDE